MSTRIRLYSGLGLIMVVIGLLIRTAIVRSSSYYVTVNELSGEGPSAIGQDVTVSGMIVGKSVQWSPQSQLLRFSIQDKPGERMLPVVYHGSRPDDFSNDWPVIVSGRLGQNGVFNAEKLLIKCPSKYQAKNAASSATG